MAFRNHPDTKLHKLVHPVVSLFPVPRKDHKSEEWVFIKYQYPVSVDVLPVNHHIQGVKEIFVSEKKEVPSSAESLSKEIYIISLQGKPIFPGIFTPIMVNSADDLAVIRKSTGDDNLIALVLTQYPDNLNPKPKDLYRVGTVARIIKQINLPDGAVNLFIRTLKRIKINKILNSKAPYKASVEYIEETVDTQNKEIKGLTRALVSEIKHFSENNPLFSEEMRLNMVNVDNPGQIADFIVSILNLEREKQQEILETFKVKKRLQDVLILINKEKELAKIQKKIISEINEKIEKSQRDYFLREEMKAIKKELGEETNPQEEEYKKFKNIIEKFQFKGEIAEQVQRELDKFEHIEPSSSEYTLRRSYLDWIVSLPWNKTEVQEVEMNEAAEILKKDHYGLNDVKERIMEYLAIRKLKNDSKGSILLLAGPPGVGKTSLGISIARAMKREFFRFSVGGMRDEAEIKGHRRTYIGAMPGKIIQGLKIVKSSSPVFMIDEIDKLGMSYQGDPSSALLEVLDPEQNDKFRDHYLDLPFDLSNIVFIATANNLDSIPAPLLDRMETIRLSGYIMEEKIEIAKRYLIPKSLKNHGLKRGLLSYNRTTLKAIAEGYAREAGMRAFEKAVNRIHRKVARKILEKTVEPPVKITPETLEGYLKKPYFRQDELITVNRPGITLGLAWTNLGGDVLVIEVESFIGKEGFRITGQMGDVMKESTSIAYTHARKIIEKLAGNSAAKFFTDRQIHLHIPEGATPKDGPSAGITMTTALLSLAINEKARANTAMTGELSLTGKVLPIGGLKEKAIAARRHKIRNIIIPKSNQPDLDEIPDNIKNGITFHCVEYFDEVLKLVLPRLSAKISSLSG